LRRIKQPMLEKLIWRLKSAPRLKIIKFLVIFSITGSSCLVVSDKISEYLVTMVGLGQHVAINIILITITYQILLLFFCFIFGELGYVMGKYRKLRALVMRSK